MGVVSSDSYKCSEEYMFNEEGIFGEDLVMCVGEWLWSRNSFSGKGGIDGWENK